MPILTKSGRVVIAESIQLRPVHIAWGTGDNAWTTPPAENANAVALLNEVGRRVAVASFVTPDVNGDIVLPEGSFVLSATPTNYLYVKTKFTFADASSDVI